MWMLLKVPSYAHVCGACLSMHTSDAYFAKCTYCVSICISELQLHGGSIRSRAVECLTCLPAPQVKGGLFELIGFSVPAVARQVVTYSKLTTFWPTLLAVCNMLLYCVAAHKQRRSVLALGQRHIHVTSHTYTPTDSMDVSEEYTICTCPGLFGLFGHIHD